MRALPTAKGSGTSTCQGLPSARCGAAEAAAQAHGAAFAAEGGERLGRPVRGANMFLGWGLDFIVAVDDDRQGRDVFNQLKKDLFGDQDELARRQLLKLPGCTSIEEVFSPTDFKRFVLNNENADVSLGNAEYLKASHISKPVAAFQFWLAVESGKYKVEAFEAQTTQRIETIVQAIVKLLNARPTA